MVLGGKACIAHPAMQGLMAVSILLSTCLLNPGPRRGVGYLGRQTAPRGRRRGPRTGGTRPPADGRQPARGRLSKTLWGHSAGCVVSSCTQIVRPPALSTVRWAAAPRRRARTATAARPAPAALARAPIAARPAGERPAIALADEFHPRRTQRASGGDAAPRARGHGPCASGRARRTEAWSCSS